MTGTERLVADIVRNSALPPSELRSAFANFLWTGDGPFPQHVRADPHALGWLHQYLGAAARHSSYTDHTRRERKHADGHTTTQLFTPRWVADWLVDGLVDSERLSVLDPACGAGQMLLAAAHRLQRVGAAPRDAFAAVRGVDIDPQAVWACRESLKRAAFEATGVREPNLERAIDRNVVCADALFDDVQRADIVVTNPPYMGSRSMPAPLKQRLRTFAPFHHDLYLAFVARCAALARSRIGVLAQQTLWYLRRFEAARRVLLETGSLRRFAHLGPGVFGALSGEKATVVAFTWQHEGTDEPCDFWDVRDADDKEAALQREPTRRHTADFDALPGAPAAFWLPPRVLNLFADSRRLADVASVPGSQNKTGDNSRFVAPIDEAPDGWVPYSKGGRFAPWWGNWDWAVDWSDEARTFYATNPTSNLLAQRWWFREGLCYSDFGGRSFNARWMPAGCIFDMAGPAIFIDDDDPDSLAALLVVLNSTTARTILNALNPTLHFQVRDVRNVPLPRGWSDAVIARLAEYGHSLVDRTRSAIVDRSIAPIELEEEADRVVAELYGCAELVASRADRPIHHRLRSV